CLRAKLLARFGSRAAMATICTSCTERAGWVNAMGTIAAAPSTPTRMGEDGIIASFRITECLLLSQQAYPLPILLPIFRLACPKFDGPARKGWAVQKR